MSSITREIPSSEMGELVAASRSPEEVDTASLGGAEMDALLSGEHAALKPPKVPSLMDRPRLSVPSPGEPTVVLAPELTAPAPAAPKPPASPAEAPPATLAAAQAAAVLEQAKMETASPFEATRVASSYASARKPGAVVAAPSRTLLYVGVGSLALGVVGAIVFALALRPKEGTEAPAPSATVSERVGVSASEPSGGPPSQASSGQAAGGPAPSGSAGATAKSTSPQAGSAEDAAALASLGRLRDGVGKCVREVIGLLPGTSPPLPTVFATLKSGPYQTVPRDYRSPVFSCTKFRETEPLRFQIQWQLIKRPSEGLGVVWLDDDKDGKPDRAFAFRAVLTGKNQVDLGEIGLMSPMPALMKAQE